MARSHTLALLCTLALCTGCSTLVNSSHQRFSVITNPAGATVTIKHMKTSHVVFSGTTPTVASLKRGDGFFRGADYELRIEKLGYKPVVAAIESRTAGWYLWGNLFSFQILGWLIVDPMTGCMWTLEARTIHDGSSVVSGPEGLNVALLEQIPEQERTRLVPLVMNEPQKALP